MVSGADSPFQDMLLALARKDVDFIVAGGVAAVLHGVPRVTYDLDISVDMAPENVARLLDAMREEGLQPRAPVPAEALMDAEAVDKMVREKGALVFTFLDPGDPLRHVDVFLTRELSYGQLVGQAETAELHGYRIRILSARHLLKLKEAIRPPRDKDALDIQYLRKRVSGEDE